ncbi:Succinate--CoA ligase (ADP-forming) [[Leptolyngbya] sp. PCC 7376]|uniref:succinate--CoA ligase subunit alpha n=1 Tax=[Leptolyngbya] sp. PCC 7376 TaxID=111781 RepID=UPI00029EDB70|nr:succinate--CoA ligase [[Leptolyngbya] sp. PCC 7376]AFY37622.1 Succinate--CoA ligase (ADP-forming) [[Leptolyngbya] sp. PCC 7376]
MINWETNKNILVQGIDTPLAQYYVPRMLAYGTQIVAGVSAGRGGKTIDNIPVFDLVTTANSELGKMTTSLIFVDTFEVLDAASEAIAAGIKQLVIVSEDVPPLDMVRLFRKAKKYDVRILGPGSSGFVLPGALWLGTGFVDHFMAGEVALLSRFHSLAQEAAIALNKAGFGQSCVIDVGNAELPGSTLTQWLNILDADPKTKAIALLGRYGSREEVQAIPFIREQLSTPVVTYLCGSHAPLDRSCHNAGTIIANQLSYCLSENYSETEMAALFKREKLSFARSLSDLPKLIQKAIASPKSHRQRKSKSSAK